MAGTTYPINGEALLDIIRDRKLKASHISKDMGLGTGYISGCCKAGKIGAAALQLLTIKYGIPYEDYAPQEEPEPDEEEIVPEVVEALPAPSPAPVTGLTKEDIYRAVMDANQASIEIFLHKLAVMCQKGDRNTRGPLYDTFQASVFYGIQGVWLNQKDSIETMLANAIRSALRTNGR